MATFDSINLEPLPALTSGIASGESGRAVVVAKLFHGDEDDSLADAKTDSEIARAFLYHAELAPTTLKSTKTELGRFLLWCKVINKTLREIRVEDLNAYKAFLRDPQPVDEWVSPTRWPRSDSRWRPFSGPLSDPSARQAFRVVKSLMTFATNAGYLHRNAGSLVKNIKTPRDARVTRYLSVPAVDYVYAALDALPATTAAASKAKARLRFIFIAYLTTGARLSEIVAATMGALYTEGDGRWWLDVVGKGSKPRRLPVATEMLGAYRDYRTAYGLLPGTTRDDVMPLVLSTRGQQRLAVTDEAASNALKRLFWAGADLAQDRGELDAAAVLRNASAHWLRHTMLTTHANNGVALKTLQDTAGHASLSTTATYLHKSDKERHDEIISSLENTGS